MIPRIIHQSWKVEAVPERWLAFQASWKAHHPGYEYRFWTDEDNRAFVRDQFPQFLDLYDGYPHPVSRADLARCLVVSHFGGIYADLDCEALRPFDDLLAGRKLVFGLEPQSHVVKPAVAVRGFDHIVCNAVFAAEPKHPFWDHLFRLMLGSGGNGNVLEASGPLVLTRACDSYERSQDITILPSNVFYPIDHFLQETTEAQVGRQESYAVHHWAGTWWRGAVLTNARRRIEAARKPS